ncbi:hypothetical protein EDC50_1861 [Vulcaniibacterium tengchongense]|uniref:Uncharacterized protein n=2 Tax=Vulcaniibacterium tengchongense TaxID=1273429 RepID=A0A3N4W1U5_9GAMM|nr:hypothetical protein EDC50_1861 [Vulcaniibacterium tengchongense]
MVLGILVSPGDASRQFRVTVCRFCIDEELAKNDESLVLAIIGDYDPACGQACYFCETRA